MDGSSSGLSALELRRLMSLNAPQVALGARCDVTVIKQEELENEHAPHVNMSQPEVPSSTSFCSLCTTCPGAAALSLFCSQEAETRSYLQSLLVVGAGFEDEGDFWIFCSTCRFALTRLFDHRRQVGEIEARIKAVVTLRGPNPPCSNPVSTSNVKDKYNDDDTNDDDPLFCCFLKGPRTLAGITERENDDGSADIDIKFEPCDDIAESSEKDSSERTLVPVAQPTRRRRRYNQCLPCGKKFKIRKEYNSHMKKIKHPRRKIDPASLPPIQSLQSAEGRRLFLCPHCGDQFKQKDSILQHMSRFHGLVVPGIRMTCPICKTRFHNRNLFKAHSHPDKDNSKKVSYKCDICGKGLATGTGLSTHKKLMHFKRFEKSCPQGCGKTFLKPTTYATHIAMCPLANQEEQRRCGDCGKLFPNGAERLDHERVVHKGGTSYKCYFCTKILTHLEGLSIHMRLHTREVPYACGNCGKTFVVECDYKRHWRSVCGSDKGKRRTEKVCRDGSQESRSLCRARQKRIHRHTCPLCGDTFNSRRQIRWHMQKSHIGSLPALSTSRHIPYFENEKGGRGRYGCPECGKKLSSKDSVLIHCSTYHCPKSTNPLPQTCPVCKEGFRSNELFKAHTHPDRGNPTKVRYKCNLCSATLASKSHLTRHKTAIHFRKERPKCSSCGKVTQTATSLRRHSKICGKQRRCGKRIATRGLIWMKCYFCTKQLSPDEGHIGRHMRIHTRERLL